MAYAPTEKVAGSAATWLLAGPGAERLPAPEHVPLATPGTGGDAGTDDAYTIDDAGQGQGQGQGQGHGGHTGAGAARVAWLRRCAPVIMQPAVDIRHGFGLRRIFFDFRAEERTCELSLVYDGEASYAWTRPASYNRVATFFYRSFNYRTYKRTADVDRLVYEGVDLARGGVDLPHATPHATPWEALFTTDYSRDQTWSRGDRGSVCWWFGVMSHYNARLPAAAWGRDATHRDRPVVWLSTSNHMMKECNVNAGTRFPGGWHAWELGGYEACFGTRDYAEAWAQQAMPVKTNCFSCCCWRAARPAAGAPTPA